MNVSDISSYLHQLWCDTEIPVISIHDRQWVLLIFLKLLLTLLTEGDAKFQLEASENNL